MTHAEKAVLANLPSSLSTRVVLRRCVPGDRWRTTSLWADSDESAVEAATRDFRKQAALMIDGGLALVVAGRIRFLRMCGA